MLVSRPVLVSLAGLALAACSGSSGSQQSSATGGAATTTSTGIVTETGGAGSTASTGSSGTGRGGAAASTSATTTTSTGTGMGGTPNVPAAPQVIDFGGTVLATPKVQLIVYAQDSFAADADAFVKEFGSNTGWAAQTSEYGVGPYTMLPTIQIPGTPPAKLDDDSGNITPFEQTLIDNISGANPAWAPEDGSTMYVFLLPLGTDISSGGHCCSDFLGYHYEAPLSSGGAPYAVVCNCPPQQGDPIPPLEYVTTSLSHEMVEAATDPFVDSNPAFAQTDDAHAIWTLATGGEVADMCEYNSDADYLLPGAKYKIQRSWSNAAAKAGKNPCVPGGEPYFNSYAVLGDSITLSAYGSPWTTKGVSIPVGQSKTIDVVLASDGAVAGPWTVKAWDYNDYLGYPGNTTVSLDKTSGSNGDVLKLTIKVNSYDKSIGGAGFVLESTLNGQDNLSFGAVGM